MNAVITTVTAVHWFHPFVFISIWGMALLTILIFRTKADLPTFITALNSVGEQPTAIVVIIIGCVMLVMCKEFGMDSTIAGGIIGVGSNMLQNKFKAAIVGDSNSNATTTISSTSTPKV